MALLSTGSLKYQCPADLQGKHYDGKTDPEDHVIYYKNRMGTCHIPLKSIEAIMCKKFGATLTGVA